MLTLIVTIVFAFFIGGFFLYTSSSKPATSSIQEKLPEKTSSVEKKETRSRTSSGAQTQKNTQKKKKKKKSKFLERNVPGHSQRTVCATISNDGELIAVGNVEGRVYVYLKSTLSNPSPRYHLLKDTQDITACSIHAENNLIVCASSKDNSLRFYILPKFKSNFSQQKFATHIGSTRQGFCADIMTGHKVGSRISSVILASTGVKPYVVTCASGGSGDTSVRFFNLRGRLLANVDSHQIDNRSLSISSDSRFVAVSSLSSEIKIYIVHRHKKTGVFEKVSKAMSLNGHSDSVQAVRFGFHPKGRHRIVSGSNDGTISMWDTDVRFNLGVNPARLCVCELGGEVRAVSLSPDTNFIGALVIDKSNCVRLLVISKTKSDYEVMKSIVLEECYVESKQENFWQLQFFPDGKSVLLLIPGCKNAQIYKI